MAGRALKSEKNIFNFLDALFFAVLLLIIAGIGLVCFNITYPEGDVMEHLYDTFMVANGKVPYVDFFEHHHPLLWYLSVPLVRLLDRNVEIINWANFTTFCFFLWGLYFVYRTITDFLSTRTAALATVIYALIPNVFIYYIYFKPDNWMLPMLSLGIYYYFSYLKNKKRRELVISYLAFFTAFLFSQKALLYYPVIGLASIYEIWRKNIDIKDFAAAVILPIVLSLFGLGYFYFAGGLKEYFYLNFLFNGKMVDFIGESKTSWPFYMGEIIIGIALFFSVYSFKGEGKYFRFYCWLFWLIVLQRAFYFSPHTYYWYDAYYFALPIAVTGLFSLIKKMPILLYALVIETVCYASFLGYDIYSDAFYKPKRIIPISQEFVINTMTPCDTFVGFNGGTLSLFNEHETYYWFLLGEIDVYGEKAGLHAVEDLNKIILEKMPKLIYVDVVYERFNKDKKIIHQPDFELLEKFYRPTIYASDAAGFDFEEMKEKKETFKRGIWILKSAYRFKGTCQKTDEGWKYVRN